MNFKWLKDRFDPDARTSRHRALALGVREIVELDPSQSVKHHPPNEPGEIVTRFRVPAPAPVTPTRAMVIEIRNTSVAVLFGGTAFTQSWSTSDEEHPRAASLTSQMLTDIEETIRQIQSDEVVGLTLMYLSHEPYGTPASHMSVRLADVPDEMKRHADGCREYEEPRAEVASWTGKADATY